MTTASDRGGPEVPDLQLYNKRIAAEIRAEMARKNITQTRLAEEVFDTYPQKIQSRVKGHVPLGAAELLAIADFLGTDVVKFLNAAKGEPPTPNTPRVSHQKFGVNLRLLRGTGLVTPDRALLVSVA